MEFVKTVTIDELGRILVPHPIREKSGWQMGTKLDVYYIDDDTVIVKLHEPSEN